jgi:probable HAF family extracellular repeat protein
MVEGVARGGVAKIVEGVPFPGAFDTQAKGINNSGQIVGAHADAANNQRGFLATEAPEPASFLLTG